MNERWCGLFKKREWEMTWLVYGIGCATVRLSGWFLVTCVLVIFYLLCGGICKMICVWKYFEIDFVWRGACLLYICWCTLCKLKRFIMMLLYLSVITFIK